MSNMPLDNDSAPLPNIYIDTSALRAMSFHKQLTALLELSRLGKARVFICETTLWERGRQHHEKETDSNRVLPPVDLSIILAWFKVLFEKYGVTIIKSDDSINDRAGFHIRNDESYFKQEDENDQRDAHVLAAAELKLDKSTIILCRDKKLASAFEDVGGFVTVRRDVDEFLSEIFGEEMDLPILEKPRFEALGEYLIATTFTDSFRAFIASADHRSHGYIVSLPTITDKLDAKLAGMQTEDSEIRRRILGYTRWFSPISKSELNSLLESRRYNDTQVESNAQRLVQENIIIETENHWMTNNQDDEANEINDQAMASVMPEIIEMMELD